MTQKSLIATHVKTLKARLKADARAKAKADKQAADAVLMAQAKRMAEADSNTRQLQRRAMGEAAHLEAHPYTSTVEIANVVRATVTLGQSDVVSRQMAENALKMIVYAFTLFRQTAAAQAGVRAGGHTPLIDASVDGLISTLTDQCRMAKDNVQFERLGK
jgi:hypothetical protein